MDKLTMTKQIFDLCNELPECCSPFLLETGTELANTTRLAYARELDWFFDYLIENARYFADKKKKDLTLEDIKQVTSQDISRYITMYNDIGLKERTIARKRAALSRFFSYMTDNQKIPYNPVAAAVRVKIHQSDEVVYLNTDEQLNFIEAVESGCKLDENKAKYHDKYRLRDTALILLLLDTGMRVSELQGINIQDFDFDSCSVIVVRKGGNMQTIYFSDDTKEVLLEYLEEKKAKDQFLSLTDPFFTSLKGVRLTVRAIELLVKKYAVSSIPGKGQKISPHKMRSSFAMEFYDETKDILALQRKLGHKNITATNIYAKATDKKMQETRNILSKRRQEKEPE